MTQVVPNPSYSAQPTNAIWRLSAWPLQKQIMQLIHGDNRDYDQALRFTVLVERAYYERDAPESVHFR